MNAAEIAVALDGRKTLRGWCARCPSHPDKHPSLDLEDRDGKVLLIDRSGRCTQAEVIAALRERGLWSPESRPSRPFIADPFPASAFHEPTAAPCCFEQPSQCEHWQAFDRAWVLGELHRNLHEACRELIEKFERAGKPVTAAALRSGIEFALPVGTIAPAGVGTAIVAKAIDLVANEFIATRRQAAA